MMIAAMFFGYATHDLIHGEGELSTEERYRLLFQSLYDEGLLNQQAIEMMQDDVKTGRYNWRL